MKKPEKLHPNLMAEAVTPEAAALWRTQHSNNKRKAGASTGQVIPLPRSPNLFVRVPLQWLTNPVQGEIFPPELRLLLFIQFRSREGQCGVKVTNQFAAEVRVEPRTKSDIIRRLEAKKLLRVERSSPRNAPVVWPILLRG